MSVAIFAVAAILLLMVVSGGYVFVVACQRRKEYPWLEEEIKNTPYGKYYDSIHEADSWLKAHGAEDVYVMSDDGLRLHGLWVPAENPAGTIVLVHGYRSTMLVDFGVALDYYHNKGLNLLIPQQRSHGESEGRYITFGVKESKDMLRWLAYHNSRFPRMPVLFSGLSMGASTVMYLADEDLPENVKGMIVDCGFTSPKDILSCVFRRVTHMPAWLSLWVTDLFARIFAGFHLTQKDSRKTLAKNRLPILMVHGTEDGFVPCEMTRQGYAVCTGPKQLLLVDGADHGVSFLVDRERYTAMIEEFLNKTILR
jgi:fermentation-respiration switch protein FrsA (DUF1100 family)